MIIDYLMVAFVLSLPVLIPYSFWSMWKIRKEEQEEFETMDIDLSEIEDIPEEGLRQSILDTIRDLSKTVDLDVERFIEKYYE